MAKVKYEYANKEFAIPQEIELQDAAILKELNKLGEDGWLLIVRRGSAFRGNEEICKALMVRVKMEECQK